ncbi:MAG: VTT domain-containing protein [Candidatus Acetothermia bacterium]
MFWNALWQSFYVTVYGFLVAVALPTPSEAMLVAAPALPIHLTIFLSGIGKTIGSYVAYFAARNLLKSNVVEDRLLKWFHLQELHEKVESATFSAVKKYGYAGLFVLLCIPGLPDTASIYAFSFVQVNRVLFLALVFSASLIRLYLVWWGLASVLKFI